MRYHLFKSSDAQPVVTLPWLWLTRLCPVFLLKRWQSYRVVDSLTGLDVFECVSIYEGARS